VSLNKPQPVLKRAPYPPQVNAANPNTAESRVENEHRAHCKCTGRLVNSGDGANGAGGDGEGEWMVGDALATRTVELFLVSPLSRLLALGSTLLRPLLGSTLLRLLRGWCGGVILPLVFGRNLQCKPVRGVNFREECHWSHACSLQARGIQWHPRV
jgi:hypothetical protein